MTVPIPNTESAEDFSTEDFFDVPPTAPDDPLRNDLLAMVWSRYRATPRHLQVQLGPSEIAHPCMRKLAYGMMAMPECNPPFDPLPSIIGTAVHTWMESAAAHANEVLGRTRWLTETRVPVAPGLTGTADLYDHDTATVVDWKCVGTPQLRKYRKDPGVAYKTQVHLYGRGFENMGLPVKRVAIAFVPRGATLHSLHVWSADYDPKVADWALDRRDKVIALIDDLQVESNPDRFRWIPVTQFQCSYCEWFSDRPQGPLQCRGDGS